MYLIHRTNSRARFIPAGTRDEDVEIPAIWTQWSFNDCGCCPGFGVHKVCVESDDLLQEHKGVWNLYLVEERPGRHDQHYFYKFVLIPRGTRYYGKKYCQRNRKWSFKGAMQARHVSQRLRRFLKPYQDGTMMRRYGNNKRAEKFHVHIGIMIDEIYNDSA